MAEASRIFQTTILPTFSPQLHQHKPRYFYTHTYSHSQAYPSLCLKKLRLGVQCSVSTGETKTTSSSAIQEVPWGCDIDSLENAEALQKWLSDSGLPPQKMAIDKVEVGERGLVALKNIRKGEKLLFVPPSLFITADSVSLFWSIFMLLYIWV